MGAMDARYLYRNLAVNKYLHTVCILLDFFNVAVVLQINIFKILYVYQYGQCRIVGWQP